MGEWKKQYDGKYVTIGSILHKMRTVENPDGTYHISMDRVPAGEPREQPLSRDPERIGNVPF